MKTRKPAQDRKADILHSALALAFDVGPDRVTTGMIADRLDLTQPAIYRHFPSKDDIWQAVADSLCAEIAQNIARAASFPPETRLRQLVLGHLRLVQKTPALPEIMVMRDPPGGQGTFRVQLRGGMAGFRTALIGAIDAMRAQGVIRADINIQDAATLVIGIIQGLVLRLLLSRDPGNLVDDAERLLNLQLSVLAGTGERL